MTDTAGHAYRDVDLPRRRRWYTAAELDGYQLTRSTEHATDGAWDVIIAGERVGQLRPAYGATGRRSGWQAWAAPEGWPIPHRGKGKAARSKTGAVADVVFDLRMRWENRRPRPR
jgi:hypothetical protein